MTAATMATARVKGRKNFIINSFGYGPCCAPAGASLQG
jgi:hypothetical protein